MRTRLRPAHSPERLAEIYATPHNHTQWFDHRVRVAVTAVFARSIAGQPATAADLSCGDGAILRFLEAGRSYYGDFAPRYDLTGPIERTIEQIPTVDLLVCCETLEHLDDPDVVLKAARSKARTLVLSTPVGAFTDTNIEHYWAWDREGVEEMLRSAGWDPAIYTELDFRPSGLEYSFGVWYAR